MARPVMERRKIAESSRMEQPGAPIRATRGRPPEGATARHGDCDGSGSTHPESTPMAEREIRERDILVAANEYAYVQDLTKGDIVLYVGPTKISLSNTERLVELRNDRFVPARGEESGAGIHPFIAATSAQYILLENPPKDAAARPVKGSNSATELLAGRRVVVPGPATFPLWPG